MAKAFLFLNFLFAASRMGARQAEGLGRAAAARHLTSAAIQGRAAAEGLGAQRQGASAPQLPCATRGSELEPDFFPRFEFFLRCPPFF